MLTFALYLAQAILLQESGKNSGLLLIDDLPSELDVSHQSLVMDILRELPMQVVISCIDHQLIEMSQGTAKRLFHVKHGEVREE